MLGTPGAGERMVVLSSPWFPAKLCQDWDTTVVCWHRAPQPRAHLGALQQRLGALGDAAGHAGREVNGSSSNWQAQQGEA